MSNLQREYAYTEAEKVKATFLLKSLVCARITWASDRITTTEYEIEQRTLLDSAQAMFLLVAARDAKERAQDRMDSLREEHAEEPAEKSDREEHGTHWNNDGKA